jgi:two-component system sensor histidine kinase/response regulator
VTESPAVLDVDAALHRMGGMRALYRRAAGTACAEWAPWLAVTVPPEPSDDLVRRLHTLKGSAGMLGANQLAALAARLERDYRAAISADARAGLWRELLEAMAAARKALEQSLVAMDVASESASETAPVPNPSELDVALRRLMDVLLACDLQALSQFAEVRPALAALGTDELEALETAIHNLQFDVAHALCQTIAQRHAGQAPSAA